MGMLKTNDVPPNPFACPEEFRDAVSGVGAAASVADEQTPEERNLSLLKDSQGNLFLADSARLCWVLSFTPLGIEAKTLDTCEHKVYHLSNAAFLRLAKERDALEK